MGKSLSREDRKNSKYILREAGRKEKEKNQYNALKSDKPARPKPKPKYRSHNDWDED
jgi:hypothetical protein